MPPFVFKASRKTLNPQLGRHLVAGSGAELSVRFSPVTSAGDVGGYPHSRFG